MEVYVLVFDESEVVLGFLESVVDFLQLFFFGEQVGAELNVDCHWLIKINENIAVTVNS